MSENKFEKEIRNYTCPTSKQVVRLHQTLCPCAKQGEQKPAQSKEFLKFTSDEKLLPSPNRYIQERTIDRVKQKYLATHFEQPPAQNTFSEENVERAASWLLDNADGMNCDELTKIEWLDLARSLLASLNQGHGKADAKREAECSRGNALLCGDMVKELKAENAELRKAKDKVLSCTNERWCRHVQDAYERGRSDEKKGRK